MNPASDTDDSQTTLITTTRKFFAWAPDSHRKLAVVACLLNLHFGIPALVFSFLAQHDFEAGDAKTGTKRAKVAYKLSIAGICMTLFFVLHFILLHLFVFPYTLYPKLFHSHS